MTNIFFTSDPHYDHLGSMNFWGRKKYNFQNLNQMNDLLINNWNELVPSSGTVYILGDFTLHKDKNRISNILTQLRGKKILIRGNHDKLKSGEYYTAGFSDVCDYKEININKQKIILSHYSLLVWKNCHYESWCLYGHSHGVLEHINRKEFITNHPELNFHFSTKTMDVGVETNNFYPYSFEDIEQIMENK